MEYKRQQGAVLSTWWRRIFRTDSVADRFQVFFFFFLPQVTLSPVGIVTRNEKRPSSGNQRVWGSSGGKQKNVRLVNVRAEGKRGGGGGRSRLRPPLLPKWL